MSKFGFRAVAIKGKVIPIVCASLKEGFNRLQWLKNQWYYLKNNLKKYFWVYMQIKGFFLPIQTNTHMYYFEKYFVESLQIM